MALTLEIDFAPAHELASSFYAFTHKSSHKVLELGASWVKSVKNRLPENFLKEIANDPEVCDLNLLVWACPGERTTEGFLTWLSGLSSGDLFDLFSRWSDQVPADLISKRDKLVWMLSEWNEQYFSQVDPAILTGLHQNAETMRSLIPLMTPIELMEKATNGFRLNPNDKLEKIILIPQYHFRPANTSSHYERLSFTKYPVDALPVGTDEPSPSLLRFTRGLSDENRLQILRFIAKTPQTFSDIVRFCGLSKGTVHYHLMLLRAAGLVRVSMTGNTVEYSVRREALKDLNSQLTHYLVEL
ncbi:winged helix-turn-helix domain-containing protein [Brevibacillus choshinensis]|uniref:ArsR/SmtB family transcription factor n=1 Tax=Brevibacillus choshinensis TaxID=54911 RepID=UPI002E1B6211|nr:winged helix-turn-helix domain-containing protein [Brevibacillus choshinensis]